VVNTCDGDVDGDGGLEVWKVDASGKCCLGTGNCGCVSGTTCEGVSVGDRQSQRDK
jgi:hypothetical protein